MILKSLALQNFRIHKSKVTHFSPEVNLIIGPNGQGKTSILESIYLLALGRSFKYAKTEEMIKIGKELGRVKAKILRNGESQKLGMILTKGSLNGKRTRKLHYLVNEIKRNKSKFVGNLLVSIFKPEDLRLIEGSPSRRRSFLNGVLEQVDEKYTNALSKYKKALTRRNKLLTKIKEGEAKPSILSYWNMTILKNGKYLQEKRQKVIEFINKTDFAVDYEMEYDPSIISEKRMEKYHKKEYVVGYTLIGPQKDDFIVKKKISSDWWDLSGYGSRGQQRLAVLWLKIAELNYIFKKKENRPILLLDDIFSELDEISQTYVFKEIKNSQSLITTTDPDMEKRIALFCQKNNLDMKVFSL